MTEFENFVEIIRTLRSENGCPWDKEQTHESLKPCCIEEAAEVIAGINLLCETGEASSLKEELGDLLMQVVMHSVIAQEEGLFTMDDVITGIRDKMIRRHPHVFGAEASAKAAGITPDQVLLNWEEIKKNEKKGKEWMDEKLPEAFTESVKLIDKARKRKGLK